MAISKVIFNGDTLMDVTGDNPATNNMLSGTRATGADGESVTGALVTAPASTANPAMNGTASPGSDDTYSRGDHVHPTDTGRAPTSHASSATTYGTGTSSNYGHLKLSDSTSSTSSTSGGIAATPAAVKAAYDLANGKQSPETTLAGYGITDAATADELSTFVRPNLLDNAYFIGGGSQQGGGQFPINQRGETSYSGTVYMIDRWTGFGAQSRLELTSGGVKLYRASTSDSCRLTQRLDPGILSSLEGQKVTLSILFDSLPTTTGNALLMLWNNTNIGQVAIEPSSPKLMSVTITVPTSGYSTADASYQRVQFSTNALSANAGVVKAMKLELGSTQTLAHQENGVWVLNEVPSFQQELAKCGRYYRQSFDGPSTSSWSGGYCSFVAGSTNSSPAIMFDEPMRTTPTVTIVFSDGTQGRVESWDGNQQVDGCIGYYASPHGFSVLKSNGFTVGTLYYFGYVASADL